MKKYLILSFIFFILIGCKFGGAVTPAEYYKQVFTSWGLEVSILVHPTASDGEQVLENEFVVLREDTKDPSLENLLVLTPQLSVYQAFDQAKDFDTVILICSSPYTLSGYFTCDYNSIVDHQSAGANLYSLNPLSETSQSLSIFVSSIGVKKVIVVPEYLLVTPAYRRVAQTYFSSLASSNEVIENRMQGKNVFLAERERILRAFDNFLIQDFYFVFFIVVLFVLAIKPIRSLIKEPKKLLLPKTYVSAFTKVLTFLESKNSFLLYFISYLTFLYLLFRSSLLFKDSLKSGTDVILGISFVNLKNTILSVTENNSDLVNLVKIGFIFVYFATLFFFLIPKIINFLQYSFDRVKSLKLGPVSKKFGGFILIYLILFGFMTFDLSLHYYYLIFLILLTLIFFLLEGFSHSTKVFLSFKERLVLLTVLLLTLGIGYWADQYKDNKKNTLTAESLFDPKRSVVVLPYDKLSNQNPEFKEFQFDGNFDIWVDHYLIYHPTYSGLINKPLSDFAPRQNMAFYDSGKGRIYKYINLTPVKQSLLTAVPSELILVTNSLPDAPVTLSLSVDCSSDVRSSSLTFKQFGLDSSEGANKAFEARALHFPGCTARERMRILSVPVSLADFPLGETLFELEGIDPIKITSIVLSDPSGRNKIDFITDVRGKPFFNVVNTTNSGELYVFSDHVRKELTFTRTGDSYDLAIAVNELKRTDVLSNPFLIWSTNTNPVLYLTTE